MPVSAADLPMLRVRGARTHNLKNVSLDLPRDAACQTSPD